MEERESKQLEKKAAVALEKTTMIAQLPQFMKYDSPFVRYTQREKYETRTFNDCSAGSHDNSSQYKTRFSAHYKYMLNLSMTVYGISKYRMFKEKVACFRWFELSQLNAQVYKLLRVSSLEAISNSKVPLDINKVIRYFTAKKKQLLAELAAITDPKERKAKRKVLLGGNGQVRNEWP